MLTDAQRALLEDKADVWERAATSGTVEWQDYNRRAAEALRAALSATPPTAGGWKPISEWPERDELIIAATDDGRRMVLGPRQLAFAVDPKPPAHPQFPATFWMYLADLPPLPSTLEDQVPDNRCADAILALPPSGGEA